MKRLFALWLAICLPLAGCNGGKTSAAAAGDQQQSSKGGASKDGSQHKEDAGQHGSDTSSAPVDSVKIAPDEQQRSGIAIGPVTVHSVPESLTVAGQVAMDERHTNHIGALADGRIEKVFVLPGDPVRNGQTLANIHSHSVHETVGALAQAFAALQRQKSAVEFATQNRDRYARLLQIQAASVEESQRAEQQLRQAEQDYKDADASVRMEREHLSELLQVPPSTLTPEHLYDREVVPIRASAPGVVISRSVTPGQVVNTGDEMFVVTNLSTVWVTASVNEKDLPKVRTGDVAHIGLQGRTSEELAGRVAMLGDVLDPQTRTVPVRISVPNPRMELRPGMFVTVGVAEGQSKPAVFVPEDAVQEVNGVPSIFTTADGETFQLRAITAGVHNGGMVLVREGLQPGEKIVVRGAFMVKSELLKGSVGEG